MNSSLSRVVANLTVFVVVCLAAAFGLIAVFANIRFTSGENYKALFDDVSGLEVGDFVRVAGVEVGQVEKISIDDKSVAVVEFSADESVTLTQGTEAAIRWENPIGDRYMALLEGAGDPKRLSPSEPIPVERTVPALDLDTLLGGFRPLFRALNPDEVNTLSTALIQAFQGEGAAIGSFLSQAAAVTNRLADRDELIDQVIKNLDVVLNSFGDQSAQLAKTVDSLSSLVKALADRRTDVTSAVANTDAAASGIADLLSEAREPLKNTVAQTDRVASIAVADHEYLDNLLTILPSAYRAIAQVGKRGDFIPEYVCSLTAKVNGKGGQPVYVKLFDQSTGRCTPK